jgi:hypothetical protein
MTWADGPEVPGPTRARSNLVAARATMRHLVGHGARPARGTEGWDIVDLPWGGRLKITTAHHQSRRAQAWRWVVRHEQRRHWGAVVWPATDGSGLCAQIPLEHFAYLVGRLAFVEEDRKRLLDG